jgi:hypothetical protein
MQPAGDVAAATGKLLPLSSLSDAQADMVMPAMSRHSNLCMAQV